jgi:hypothetical protein
MASRSTLSNRSLDTPPAIPAHLSGTLSVNSDVLLLAAAAL